MSEYAKNNTPPLPPVPVLQSETDPLSITESAHRYNLGDKLDVIRCIGTGGMGEVLEVYHNVMGVRRAVKLLGTNLRQNSEQLCRFRQEALIASELSHPNIVNVYDLDRAPDGTPYILMELLEGQDLEAIINERAPLDLKTVIQLLSGPTDALDTVHQRGVVHRDLKPANLFLTSGGTVKVLDFGISQMSDKKQDARITRVGEVVGTPMYMSPEQIMGNTVDAKADVYALGTIAYELLTGHVLFNYENLSQIAAAILAENPMPPSNYVKNLPPHVDDVFAVCFAKDKTNRYGTPMDFLRALAGQEHSHLISTVIRSQYTASSVSATNQFSTTTGNVQRAQKWNDDAAVQSRVKRLTIGIFLSIFALCILGLTGFFTYTAFFKRTHAMIQLSDIRVADENEKDHHWYEEAVKETLSMYLAADTRLTVQKETAPAVNLFDLSQEQYVLDATAEHTAQWAITLKLKELNGDPVWETTAHEKGFEPAIEIAAWKLHSFIVNESDDEMESSSSELSELLKLATIKQYLTPRHQRLIQRMQNPSYSVFWKGLNTLLKCIPGRQPVSCMQESPFPVYNATGDVEIDAIWKTLVSIDPADKSFDHDCAAFQQKGPFAEALSSVLPAKVFCTPNKNSICTDTSTFWKRYECAWSSSQTDRAATSLSYVFNNIQKDYGHWFYSSIDTLLTKGFNTKQGQMWLRRMEDRYGKEDRAVSGLMFAVSMQNRDFENALIWARRSNAPLKKVALALIGSGWLKEGNRKNIEAVFQAMSNTQTENNFIRKQIVSSLILPVLTMESALAEDWLEQTQRRELQAPLMKGASKISAHIAAPDKSALCNESPRKDELEIYRLYVCGQYNKIISQFPIMDAKQVTNKQRAFIIADAYKKNNQSQKAEQIYYEIESDPLFRVNTPGASILAIERLAVLKLESQKKADATALLKKFLNTWSALDIPLEIYLSAGKQLSVIN